MKFCYRKLSYNDVWTICEIWSRCSVYFLWEKKFEIFFLIKYFICYQIFMKDWKNVNFQTLQEIQKIWNKNFMNSFKATWMQLNSIRFIDLKIKSNFDKIKILCLCNDLSLMINHRENLVYRIINMKVDKVYRAIDNTMKKDIFWIKSDWSFVETVRSLILYWEFWRRTRTKRCWLYCIF